MTKRFIAGLLAAAIAFTGMTAAPARALDNGELGRLLLGAGALFIIGSSISNNKNRGHVNRRYDPEPVYKPRHRKVVPANCLRINHYNQGPRRYFTQHCLRKNMNNYARLPGNCRTTVWTDRGRHRVFAAGCLRQHGWVMG